MSRGENLLFDEKAGIDVDQERVFEDLYAADLDFGDGNFVGGSGGAGGEEFLDFVADGVLDRVGDAFL